MSIRDRFTAPVGSPRAQRHQRRQQTEAAFREVTTLERRWLDGCAYVGLGRVIATPAGPTIGLRPEPVHVEPTAADGSPPYLIVRLRPGQLLVDLEGRRDELARALGARFLRFSERGGDFVRVDLVMVDPLHRVVPFLPPAPRDHLVYGVDEAGAVVSRPLDALTHLAVQGSTGGGKSVFAYSLLVQLARMAPLVDLAGIDPTNLLFRPMGAHPNGLRIGGTGGAEVRYPELLACLVRDMDARIAALPPRCDALPITPATPLRFVVLEELSGVSRVTGYRQSGAPSETQRHIGRLASEGRKAGYRLLVISQRLGADVLATDTRDQLLTRLTFGTRDLATVRMLSPDATPEDLTPLAQSPAGVALAELPGEPMTRLRGPWLGDYGTYCDLIAAATGAAAA